MKLFKAVLVAAALIAAPMVGASSASAQGVVTTTTVHAYHYGHHGYRHAAVNRTCSQGYGACDSVYLSGTSATTGQAVDMDYQAPIGQRVYANGDVYLDCSCTHHR
jgi:hypothetical protein